MSKATGLGDNAYVAGVDLSSDVLSLDGAHGGPAALDLTPINAFANVRQGGLRAGELNFTTAFDPTVAHPALSGLPTADVQLMYAMGLGVGQAVGNPAMCLVGKQVNYDGTRGADGMFSFAVNAQSNSFGIEMNAKMLTPGLRTDGAATAGAFFDDLASSAFGGQAYFQLVAFTGTSVTIDVQHATTSGGTYSTTGLTSQAFTAAGAQRVSIANTATINEFLKVVTTGTFSQAVFAVAFVRNQVAGVGF